MSQWPKNLKQSFERTSAEGCANARKGKLANVQTLQRLNTNCFGVAVPSGGWLGSRTEEGRAKLR